MERGGRAIGGWVALAAAAAVSLWQQGADRGEEDELILVAPIHVVDGPLDGTTGTVAPIPSASDLPVAIHDHREPTIEQLADLRELPSRALGVPFRVHAVVATVGAAWEPYFTRFDPASWQRVELWSDDAFLWEREAFDDPLPNAFVRASSAAASRLADLAPYDRVVIEGVVREVYAGEPWIELWSMRRAEPGLTEAAVFHAVRALELEAKGLGPLARSERDKALAAPLPAHQRAALESLLDADDGAVDRQ